MELVAKVIIKGAGIFEGSVEGTQYFSGQIFVEEPFDSSKPNYKGFRTVEYKCESSDVVKPIMSHDFPVTAEIRMEISATKRDKQVVVKAIKVIGNAQPQPRPAAPQ